MRQIDREKFYKELNSLIGEYTVYAPVGDRVKKIKDTKEIKFEGLLTRFPAKEHMLPQNEELFRWNRDKKIEVKIPDTKAIIFGIRPCDARAIASLDPTFNTEKFPDPYYINRRKNTIIISIGCNNPDDTCFCTSFGSGPFDPTGSDLLVVDTGEKFLGIGKEKILDMFGFEEGNDGGEFEALKKKAEGKIERINLAGIKDKLDSLKETDFFKKISYKCINCGACTFLCPTCYCFDIEDMERIDGGKRVRIWDSCMFTIYTQETSGHNPRKQEERRMRQRIMHKFNYYPFLYDIFGCVGCGRCISYCPVNFDIRNVLKTIGGMDE